MVGSHTWSLAVEEQFYLLIPGLLFLAGKKRAFVIICGIILVSPFLRLLIHSFFPDSDLRWTSFGFQANADSLAMGCGLAFMRTRLHENKIYLWILNSKLFFIVPCIALAANLLFERPRIFLFVCVTLINLCIALSIDWAVTKPESIVGKLLNSRSLSYIGVLSYSIYLWQQPFLNRNSNFYVTSFPLNILCVAAAALLSYYLIEKPSLRWREKMEGKLFRQKVPTIPEILKTKSYKSFRELKSD